MSSTSASAASRMCSGAWTGLHPSRRPCSAVSAHLYVPPRSPLSRQPCAPTLPWHAGAGSTPEPEERSRKSEGNDTEPEGWGFKKKQTGMRCFACLCGCVRALLVCSLAWACLLLTFRQSATTPCPRCCPARGPSAR